MTSLDEAIKFIKEYEDNSISEEQFLEVFKEEFWKYDDNCDEYVWELNNLKLYMSIYNYEDDDIYKLNLYFYESNSYLLKEKFLIGDHLIYKLLESALEKKEPKINWYYNYLELTIVFEYENTKHERLEFSQDIEELIELSADNLIISNWFQKEKKDFFLDLLRNVKYEEFIESTKKERYPDYFLS